MTSSPFPIPSAHNDIINASVPEFNPKQYFDPELAVRLLAADGWSRKDGDKWMTNNAGEIFEIKEFFIYPNWDRIFNPFIEDLEQIGIKVNLVEIQNPFEKSMKKKY